MFKTFTVALRMAALGSSVSLVPVAYAQTDMSCADYLQAEAEMRAAMSPAERATAQADTQAAGVDAKTRAYCEANPKASANEAMVNAAQ